MTHDKDQVLERALIDTVDTELKVMQSFCRPDFPCDLTTTVAMRMSRAVVSTICRLDVGESSREQSVFSEQATNRLSLALQELENLSAQYELRVLQLATDDPARQSWNS